MKIQKLINENNHVALGAKMIHFAGYNMPIWYSSISDEHNCVRNNVGIFDVSHMGEFLIGGEESEKFLQRITINDVSKLNVGQAQYSAMCYPDAGIVDDLIIYKKSDGYFMVVNAGNIDKNFRWLNDNIINDVAVENKSSDISYNKEEGYIVNIKINHTTPINI